MPGRILVVEDEPEFLQLMQLVLEEAGYLVQPATTAKAAIRWLEDGPKPDLALLDIGLPDPKIDGLTLCAALKRDAATRRMPVVIVTGRLDNRSRLEASLAHADLVLHKPLEPQDLLHAVGTLLAQPRQTRRGLLHRSGLEVDPERRTVFFHGRLIEDLGPRLFDVFYLLVERWPEPLSPRRILDSLGLKDRDEEVAVMICRLRARFRKEFGGELIATVPQAGYRVDLPMAGKRLSL